MKQFSNISIDDIEFGKRAENKVISYVKNNCGDKLNVVSTYEWAGNSWSPKIDSTFGDLRISSKRNSNRYAFFDVKKSTKGFISELSIQNFCVNNNNETYYIICEENVNNIASYYVYHKKVVAAYYYAVLGADRLVKGSRSGELGINLLAGKYVGKSFRNRTPLIDFLDKFDYFVEASTIT
jgi:hypothetical protein